mgnify:FL=1
MAAVAVTSEISRYNAPMEVKIHESWRSRLAEEFEKDYFKELVAFVVDEYKTKKIYPPPANIFRAFELCPFENVKVVILGQDPYHGPRQANGLCFAVNKDVALPPSLQNIYKEIENDLGVKMPAKGTLEGWAGQGVLLLNATLTVQAGQAGSHQHKGWEEFTDAVIQKISDAKDNVVFMLWGRYAQNKGLMIPRSRHLVLEAAHPSPFSAHSGFFGSHHFSQANAYLDEHNLATINWAA